MLWFIEGVDIWQSSDLVLRFVFRTSLYAIFPCLLSTQDRSLLPLPPSSQNALMETPNNRLQLLPRPPRSPRHRRRSLLPLPSPGGMSRTSLKLYNKPRGISRTSLKLYKKPRGITRASDRVQCFSFRQEKRRLGWAGQGIFNNTYVVLAEWGSADRLFLPPVL